MNEYIEVIISARLYIMLRVYTSCTSVLGRLLWLLLLCAMMMWDYDLQFVCFAQIRPEQALAAAEARMELHELNVWKDNLLSVMEQPREEFK